MSFSSILGTVAVAGCACTAYGALYERTAFTLRRFTIPALPAGSEPLKMLHLSDAHMTPGQQSKQEWMRGLADLNPDFIISTGDNLAHADAVPAVLRAYGDLLDLPGVFVFGSNDYFSPSPKNPLRYFFSGSDGAVISRGHDLPWRELRSSFTDRGWLDLTNRHGELTVKGLKLSFVGVDDPHLGYDELDDQAADQSADLAIGVTHAPYLRVLDRWNRLGYPLLFAGHTHGGQVCVPGFGALVTNCDLDRARAKGLHTHSVDGNAPSWLHVSAGLGTNPYTPIRFACRPEASLLTLTAIDSAGS